MSFLYYISEAKSLLKDDCSINTANKLKATKLVKLFNHYRFCPTFLLSGGYSLQKKLVDKYSIKNKFRKMDCLINFPLLLLCDPIIILASIATMLALFYMIWLPNVKTNAYGKGFNETEEYAFRLSCHYEKYQRCLPCSEIFGAYKLKNGSYTYYTDKTRGCNDVKAISCPYVNRTGLDTVKFAIENNKHPYVDPNSFINDTYMTYILFGRLTGGTWMAIQCNKLMQAEVEQSYAIDGWKINIGFIIAGTIAFYIIINLIIAYFHKELIKIKNIELPSKSERIILLGAVTPA